MKQMKETIIWTIVAPNGFVEPWHDSYFRKETIRNYIEANGKDWDYWKKNGFRCIKVKITAI